MEENKTEFQEENFNVKELLFQYFIYWKWFLVSILIFLALGFFYLKVIPEEYLSEAKILLKGSSDNSSLLLGKELSEIVDGSNSKVDDQIEILKSRRLMTKVVDKLDLNVQYYQKKGLIPQEVYKEDALVFVKFVDNKSKFLVDSIKTLEITIKSKDKFVYKDIQTEKEGEGGFGKPIKFYFGDLLLLPNPTAKVNDEVIITISPIVDVSISYINLMDIQPISKVANVVSLSLKSNLPKNANNLIDLLVSQYQEDIIEDRGKLGNNTISFINERLDLISEDLGITDDSMERYKSRKGITDVVTEGQIAVQQSTKVDDQLKQYMIQLSLVDYMNDFIRSNKKSLIPSNIGLTDPSIAQSTQQYNQLVLERDNLLKSSTEENPMVKNLDDRIRELNTNLATSIKNYKTTTELAIGNLKGQLGQVKGNISELPSKERGFRDIARKQQTVEALYLLLLQKREETEIATASTPNVVKIVDKAFFPKKPVSPKIPIVLLASFLLGCIVPFGVLYVKFLLDDKVKSKKDVEKVIKTIPITGYIPRSKESLIDIKSTNSSSAEAFRVLRTDINFFLPSMKGNSKCIYITSTISGEGKTYVVVNLAFTLALTGKKVLILEADIRKPKVREYLKVSGNPEGITEYLSENISDLSQKIVSVNYPGNNSIKVNILSSGRRAPNPSELLMNGRFKDIVDYGLENYDYVIVDTAPVSAVTDTLLINDYANLLLYVVRANYLDKNLLDIPNQLKNDKKLKNHKTAILINDVDVKNRYGYGYGYGEEEKPWYKRFFK